MAAAELQVLETASEGSTPGLGTIRVEPPSHIQLLAQVLQLVRAKSKHHQVAESIIPASREDYSRVAQHLSPDLALSQEHS